VAAITMAIKASTKVGDRSKAEASAITSVQTMG
jgi:hypothetical protein